jgi:nucleotide-binding universal stress UspA family protein
MILVPVALAKTDSGLLRHASFVAGILGPVDLHFVHVRASRAPGTIDEAFTALEAAVSAQTFPESTRVAWKVLEGGALEDRLLEYASEHETDLILMGHQIAHSRRRALGRRLAMHAPCSVWIVPEGSPISLRRILVPVDFSPHSAEALRIAIALARAAGLNRISVLHVRFNEASVTFDDYEDIVQGEEHVAMDKFLARIDLSGIQVECLFEEAAHVSTAIDRVADRNRSDLVVMSTRGRSPSASVLLGSQTENVLIETERPLLVLKHQGAQLNALEALLDPRFGKQGLRFG